MATRSHSHEIELPDSPETVFALLHTPSAIRQWWSAARAIVLSEVNGFWAAAWGENEDQPDYVGSYRIAEFDPPRRLVLSDAKYFSKDGPLPFEPRFTVTFTVEPRVGGECRLRVDHDGFPTESVADGFYAACEVGWKNTFEGIARYLKQVRDGCQFAG
jgi:uncharacterized protein YndB with AHSA1/START domain